MKKSFQKWFPPLLTAVMAMWFVGQWTAPKEKDFAFSEFGQLPVVFEGRLKPMDSLARNSLLQLREKQTLNLEPWKAWNEKPKIIAADQWLVTVMMDPPTANRWPAFRIDNPDVIALLKLPGKDPAQHQDGKHYSWNQIQPEFAALEKESNRINDREKNHESDAGQRTAFERAVMKVYERCALYAQLRNTLQPEDSTDWKSELLGYENLLPAGVAAVRAQQAGQKYDEEVFNEFAGEVQRFDFMSRLDTPLIVPPANGKGEWREVGTVMLDATKGEAVDPILFQYAAMADALKRNDAEAFNAALADVRATLAAGFAPALARSRTEVFFNRMQPFYNALVIYVFAGLLAVFYWFNLSETVRRSAMWLIALAFVIHSTGLVYRSVLQGRPPVTNLYSSAIFIGWGACLLGMILERFYRNGIGAMVSAGLGFITCLIAHNLAIEGDTMEMMRAVLDNNFWLTTHVLAVTTGYASTFVAGFLALVYILRGFFTPTLDEATAKSITRMIYGIVCFATLFSFVGTVLGGIWADQSWGRFWGWDPKENGALIIVLWNALILHLRWGGMVRERGLAVCAIGGNIVTSWSWFGVNMLGIGLHSYGFTDAAFRWLMLFVLSQVAIIVIGSMPLEKWRSFKGKAAAT